jgi:hypothetical protein
VSIKVDLLGQVPSLASSLFMTKPQLDSLVVRTTSDMLLYSEAKDILISEILAGKISLNGMEVLYNAKSKRSF